MRLVLSLKKSVLHTSHELAMPVTTVWKVLRKRLELRPYRLLLLQALKQTDYGLRAKFATTLVKVSDHGMHAMSSSPVPIKTRDVGERCTLNLSRAKTSSFWCDLVVTRGGASSGVVHVT
ncbi:hypothetical protein TNCV_2956911 [Trichonephila clavipes]|nr:hypothetical protein TNCV_2956911 [Trichonephila clavipes]